jgi:hypothetical protein
MSVATDHALATIASILDNPADAGEPDQLRTNGTATVDSEQDVSTPVEAHGYSRTGPGPMAAIRFKWTVRRADDGYYVDETVGPDSVPVSSGPMDSDAAVKHVDERATEAHQQFEALKSDMTGKGPSDSASATASVDEQ